MSALKVASSERLFQIHRAKPASVSWYNHDLMWIKTCCKCCLGEPELQSVMQNVLGWGGSGALCSDVACKPALCTSELVDWNEVFCQADDRSCPAVLVDRKLLTGDMVSSVLAEAKEHWPTVETLAPSVAWTTE